MHSTQESHTIIAMLIITALPLAAALLSAGQRPAALHAVNTVILLAGLFLTSSRIGWIAFAFICLLFLWNQRGSRKILMGALLLPAVIFLMMCAALPHYGDRLSTLGSLSRDRETHTRLQNWKMCLAIAKDHLPLGISFSHIQYYRCARDKDSHFQYEHPHNMLLQIYVSLGIPGICLFAFLLWYSVDSFRKSKGRDLPGLHGAMGASLSGFFLVNMADTVFVSPRALLFICLLMAYLSWWHSLPCREASAEQTDEQ